MGLTVLRVKVGNPAKPKVLQEVEFLDPLRRELKSLPMILASETIGFRREP